MDNSRNKYGELLENNNLNHKLLSDLSNDKDCLSIDFIYDTFQNLMLDFKSVTTSNSNKFINKFYKHNKKSYDLLCEQRMKYSDFNVLKIIGQGAFGQVQLVRHRETDELFALKMLNKSQVVSAEGTIFWKEERDIMMRIDSRWIVRLHYAFQDSKHLYMVMDYLPGGNLVNWMSKLDSILERDLCFYSAEIVLAINALHRCGYVHRDIKPDNILFDIKGHIKLADFGSCVKMDPVTKFVNSDRAIGTPDYISPEVLLSQSNKTKYGKEVDWWALGVMLYELFYGDPPFYSDQLHETYGKIMTHEQSLSFTPDDEVSDNAVDFMKKLICDRSVRLGSMTDAIDIKSHAFFTENNAKWNWDNIQEFSPPFVPDLENDLDTSYFDFEMEDVDKNFLTYCNQELSPTTFTGENLQFTGFSYSKNNRKKVDLKSADKENVNENKGDVSDEKMNALIRDNQMRKDTMEKLLIEKKDLENQLQIMTGNLKKEESISKKLQMDYSELMTKQKLNQQKFENIEEQNHKLSGDLLKLQASSDNEKERLTSECQKIDGHLKNSNRKLMEIQTEYHHMKLEWIKLENNYKSLQETYNSLVNDVARLKNGAKSKQEEMTVSELAIQNNYNVLRAEFDSKLEDLKKQETEKNGLAKVVVNLEAEKENLKNSLVEVELQFTNEVQENKKCVLDLKEKDCLIVELKSEIDKLKLSLDGVLKRETTSNLKMTKVIKLKNAEKLKFEQELEEQRNKLSKIITVKTHEIQQMKTSIEILTDTNAKLTREVEMDKIKQETLVAKINEIIHGKCTTAKEMMISEDVKSGLLGKRSGRLYNQLAKEMKKLESMYEDLQKSSKSKEMDLRKQIDLLIKEKEHLDLENSTLHDRVGYYANMNISESVNNRASVSTIASSHSSFESAYPNEFPPVSSTPFRRSIKTPLGKPPLLNHMTSLTSLKGINNYSKHDLTGEVFFDNNYDTSEIKLRHKKTDKLKRNSLSDSIQMDISNTETLLEVNVKVKGKKMSWEKRFVKNDDSFLYFYGQDMETCHLKLLFTSLVFVRSVTNADVIHAKKSEIPRIFQICYDKNVSIYSKVQTMKSARASVTSLNSADSLKSSKTNSSNEHESTLQHDVTDKKGNRRNSLTRFLPIMGNRSQKSKVNSELSIDFLNCPVFLKGHVFVIVNPDGKSSCDICKKPLDNCASAHNVKSVSDSLIHPNTSSEILTDKVYQCFHCQIRAHGTDLDSKIYSCKQSVAIQLCRASSEAEQAIWIKFLNQFTKSQMNVSTNPALSSAAFKARSSTLGS